MKAKQTKLALMVLATLGGGSAWASPVDCYDSSNGEFSSLVSYVGNPSQYDSFLQSIEQYSPECLLDNNPAGHQSITGTTLQQSSAISGMLGNRLLGLAGPQKTASLLVDGMAAGGVAGRWNVWGNFTSNDADYDSATPAVGGGTSFHESRTNTDTYVLGGDYTLMPNVVLGVSAAFDRSHGRADAAGNKLRADGYTIAPYLGWQISDNLALDASAGWGDGDRKSGTTTKNSVDRSFYAINLNHVRWMGAWQLATKAGWFHGEEDTSDNKFNGTKLPGTGGTAKLSQAKIGAELGYWMDGCMPYAGVSYVRDTTRTVDILPWDKSAWLWSAGVNFFSLKNKITGGIGYQAESGRSHTDNDSWVANLSIAF